MLTEFITTPEVRRNQALLRLQNPGRTSVALYLRFTSDRQTFTFSCNLESFFPIVLVVGDGDRLKMDDSVENVSDGLQCDRVCYSSLVLLPVDDDL